ncbi:hypothetical protein C8R44DRAFT_822592 [Mycena epipterygia]|nr:hypothetical protein C8R44DRAFT_822592 [Mycena epipterygia]
MSNIPILNIIHILCLLGRHLMQSAIGTTSFNGIKYTTARPIQGLITPGSAAVNHGPSGDDSLAHLPYRNRNRWSRIPLDSNCGLFLRSVF